MTTRWLWKNYIIASVADAYRIREIAADIDPDPASDGGFSVLLSDDGGDPATHVLGGWPMTSEMLLVVEPVLTDWHGYGLTECPRYWRCNALTCELASSNVSETGSAWTLDDVLAAAGLHVIRADERP